MKPVLFSLSALFAASTLMAAPVAVAQTDAPASISAENGTLMTWFVEIDGDKNAFRKSARGAGIEFTERFAFGTLWNGLSVRASASQAAAMSQLKGVTAVFPVERIRPTPITDVNTPELITALQMTGADVVQANGLDGTGVTFGAYRVFGCSGSTSSDIMLAAMERAYLDGMDVVNMSIGAGYQWAEYPTSVAAASLVERGVIVVTSTGNAGATGLYSESAPGVSDQVIGAGAVNNTHSHNAFFTVSPDNGAVPYNDATGAPQPPTSGTFQMARTGTTATTNDACNTNPPAAGSLTGKVALVQRGSCSFHEKSLNAQLAGAVAVVIYNNTSGLQSITVEGVPAINVPVVSITQGAGQVLDSRIAAGTLQMTWQEGVISQPAAGGGLTASFSSYGLSPSLLLKPDLTAPGGAIRSTYPLGFGGYAVIGGTSMASPHVAGSVALLLQSDPDMTAFEARERLQNTAQPILWWGAPGLGYLDQVHRQGAGLIRIDRALATTGNVSPSRLSLGDNDENRKHKLTVSNNGDESVTYTVHHEPALATGPNTFTVGAYAGFAGVSLSSTSLTVAPGKSADLHVDFTAPGLPANSIFGGYLVFTPDNGEPTLRVPYAGFDGDYQSIQVLAPTAFGFPWLAQLSGGSYFNRPAGATFTMVGDDVPFILFHAAHQSRRFEVSVRGAGSNSANFHKVIDIDYLRRNAANDPAVNPDFFLSLAFDGFTFNPSGARVFMVPDGDYVLEVKVQRALGNPSDTETWTSPVFTIDRP